MKPVVNMSLFLFFLSGWFPQSVNAQETAFPQHKVTVLTESLSEPWSMAFLPNGALLITEKKGHLRVWQKGVLSKPVNGLPEVFYRGQGGLLDVVLHPDYENNQLIYISYAFGDKNKNALRLARAILKQDGVDYTLDGVEVLFTVDPYKNTPVHYGGRIAFLPDKTLLLTSGDGFDFRESAQRFDSLLGKIIRLNEDGSIASDNPFVGDNEKHGAIWSLGHRNPQSIVYDVKRNRVFSHEHGPAGGDEINIIEPGKNYGWPVITNGKDYSGANISPFKIYQGMEQPYVDWTPSIAPSSMVIYYGDMFPNLAGDLLVTTLKSQELRWIDLVSEEAVAQQSLLTNMNERFRDVKVAPSGAIFLLTDSGKLLSIQR